MFFFLASFCLTEQPQDGVPRPLLPPIALQHAGRKCLVLDLDETLIHGSFKVCFHLPPFSNKLTFHAVYPTCGLHRPGRD